MAIQVETNLDNPVFIAAPSRPKSNQIIKMGSATTATKPADIVTNIARYASPSERRIAEPIIPIAINGNVGTEIKRNLSANKAVSPVAPVKAIIFDLNITIKIATSA